MKKILMLAMVLGLLMINICYAEPVKICGVTLGKPFTIPECKGKEDSICYRKDPFEVSVPSSCTTHLFNALHLNLGQNIYVRLSVHCDRTSEVEGIQIDFNKENYNDLLALMESKFGKSSITTTTPVQTIGGAKFEQIEKVWKFSGGEEIYLTNMWRKVPMGILSASSTAKVARDSERINKQADKDKKNF